MNAINEQLWIERGGDATTAHRVVAIGPTHIAQVDGRRCRAVLVRKIDRTGEGSVLVPAAELTEAAPLSADDEREYARLDAELAGTIGDTAKLRRFNALRLRGLVYGDARA